jgi:hypothetical protein
MTRDADLRERHPPSGLVLALLLSMGLWVFLLLLAQRFAG